MSVASEKIITRQALGQVASLGSLYDARSDKIIPISIIGQAAPQSSVDPTDKHKTHFEYINTDSYKDKLDKLNVDGQLSASFLAGLINVGGSGSYLNRKQEKSRVLHMSMRYNVDTVHERLVLEDETLKGRVNTQALRMENATHVIIAIQWGARCVVTAKQQLTEVDQRQEIEGKLAGKFKKLEGIAIEGEMDLDKENSEEKEDKNIEIVVDVDLKSTDGLVPTTFAAAARYIRNIEAYLKEANGGKGTALSYTMVPIGPLVKFLGYTLQRVETICNFQVSCLADFVQLFDRCRTTRIALQDHHDFLNDHNSYLDPKFLKAATDDIHLFEKAETNLRLLFAEKLVAVRSGQSESISLTELLQQSRANTELLPDFNATIDKKARRKIEFMELLRVKGAIYVGFNGASLRSEHAKANELKKDLYVLRFNEKALEDSERMSEVETRWSRHQRMVTDLLESENEQCEVVLFDHDATELDLEKVRLEHFRPKGLVNTDVEASLQQTSTARCQFVALDRKKRDLPLKRRFIKMQCPGEECDRNRRCLWNCHRCGQEIEYGFDDYIYCGCGRAYYFKYEFRCNSYQHGICYDVFDKDMLLERLLNLGENDARNILILGETGVGKSTFINAMVNYLRFETLEEAQNAEALECVIPAAFSWNTVKGDQRVSEEVFAKPNLGEDKNAVVDEQHSQVGQSATQTAKVYRLRHGETVVRLIDTPGIGDTRGVVQDKKNIEDIMSRLRTFEALHGILVLLKPNNSRATAAFNFVFKEMLVHLHRDAARNVIFGFTNGRGTSFEPGDTLPLIESLVKKDDIDLSIVLNTTYVFDSECFRYLAAYHQGIRENMAKKFPLFQSSWDWSKQETARLFKHLDTISPHSVGSTLTLNETRHTIQLLSVPMALLTKENNKNLSIIADKVKELERTREKGESISAKLWCDKVAYRANPTEKPLTVCNDEGCFTIKGDKKHYRSPCHEPCFLKDVKVHEMQTPELLRCVAFKNQENCLKCGHSWVQHLHVKWVLQETTERVKDEAQANDLFENKSAVEKLETYKVSLETEIKEREAEQKIVQRAGSQFAFFLKRFAIKPFNDAKLSYLNLLIEEEEKKYEGTSASDTLVALRADRDEHREQVEQLKQQFEDGKTEALLDLDGARQEIQKLYNLKHSGKSLRENVDSLTVIQDRSVTTEVAVGLRHRREDHVPPGVPRKRDRSLLHMIERKVMDLVKPPRDRTLPHKAVGADNDQRSPPVPGAFVW
jgi:hypothetical protein